MSDQLCRGVQEISRTTEKVALKTREIKPEKRPSYFLDGIQLHHVQPALSIYFVKTRVNSRKRTGLSTCMRAKFKNFKSNSNDFSIESQIKSKPISHLNKFKHF